MSSEQVTQTCIREYYVYIHEIGGEIVYIGKGKGGQAWSNKRNDKIHALSIDLLIHQNDWSKCVNIYSARLTEKEALAKEAELIGELKPKYNTQNKVSLEDTVMMRKLLAGGTTKKLTAEIFRVTVAQLDYALNNRFPIDS